MQIRARSVVTKISQKSPWGSVIAPEYQRDADLTRDNTMP